MRATPTPVKNPSQGSDYTPDTLSGGTPIATDPICQMQVDEATARSATRDGETFYFCGEHCRQKFLGLAPPPPAAQGG